MPKQTEGDARPDGIKVSIVHHEEVRADRADLFVVIKGSSLVTGDAALKKAREVGLLVTELTAHGLEESDIRIQGVYAEASTGMLGRSSSAKYLLKVHCGDLNLLADILGIITAQKNTTLRSIVWGYPEEDAQTQDRRLGTAIRRANEKAARIAAGLGVTLLGVYSFREKTVDEESLSAPRSREHGVYDLSDSDHVRARRITADDLGMEVSHAKEITLHIEVEYRVSGFRRDAEAAP